jgi:transmembrane sensor
MNKEEAKGLAEKFLAGKATDEDKSKLHSWSELNADDEPEVVFTSKLENVEDVKSRLFDRIQSKINTGDQSVQHGFIGTRLWYRMVAAAAAILLIVGTSMYLYKASADSLFKDDLADAKHIPIGKNTAILTLANGKQINLSDAVNGQLADESGISITKISDGQLVYEVKAVVARGAENRLNTISTPKGGQYQVVLPDGSKVWLNAASSIKFPSDFVGLNQRKVQLMGEAYFEVAKDKLHPFIVETDKQDVEVLGTHFNINAYGDEELTKTTLLEGSVRVSLDGTSNTVHVTDAFIILKPGQQAVLATGPIKINQADTEEAVAWKNGYFKFKSESLSSIMRKLSRWYDVEVVYKGEISKDRFGGTISRYKNVADVLEMLESTKLVKFKVEGRRIIVI